MGAPRARKDQLPEVYAYIANAQLRMLNNTEKGHGGYVTFVRKKLDKKSDAALSTISDRCRESEAVLFKARP